MRDIFKYVDNIDGMRRLESAIEALEALDVTLLRSVENEVVEAVRVLSRLYSDIRREAVEIYNRIDGATDESQ